MCGSLVNHVLRLAIGSALLICGGLLDKSHMCDGCLPSRAKSPELSACLTAVFRGDTVTRIYWLGNILSVYSPNYQ